MFCYISLKENWNNGGDYTSMKLIDLLQKDFKIKKKLKYKSLFIFKKKDAEINSKRNSNIFFNRNYIKFLALVNYLPKVCSLIYRVNNLKENYKFIIYSHYLLIVPALVLQKLGFKIIFFVQSLEWEYCDNIFTKNIVKFLIEKSFFKSNLLIFTNEFLSKEFERNFLNKSKVTSFSKKIRHKSFIYPIWTNYKNLNDKNKIFQDRPIDILICLRYGFVKAPDLYLNFIKLINEIDSKFNVVAFCPLNFEDKRFNSLKFDLKRNLNMDEICKLYSSSKLFVCLSRFEGFGLPALEAMFFGAIPVLKDNGGCWNYMNSFPDLVLSKKISLKDFTFKVVSLLRDETNNQNLSNKVFDFARKSQYKIFEKQDLSIKNINKFIISNNDFIEKI